MRRHPAGFTLLEILVVMALVAVVAAVMATRIGNSSTVVLRASGRVVESELEFAAQRAMATGRAQRWVVDLDGQRFRIEEHAEPRDAPGPIDGPIDLAPPLPDASYGPIEHDRYGRWHELDEITIGIDEVIIAGESQMSGEVGIAFSPDGGADPATIWLLDPDSRELDIEVTGFTGEIRVGQVVRRE